MKTTIEIDDKQILDSIIKGQSLDGAIRQAKERVEHKIVQQIVDVMEKSIKSTKEWKDAVYYSSDSVKKIAKDYAEKAYQTSMVSLIDAELKKQAKKSPAIKSHIRDFINDFVEQEVVDTIKKQYSFSIKVNIDNTK